MQDNYTYPPCERCEAHEGLSDELKKVIENNRKEHGRIEETLNGLSTDIKWVVLIGKWMLGVLVGYMLMIAVKIYTADTVKHKEIHQIESRIKNIETNRAQDERKIDTIIGQLQIIVRRLYHSDG